MGRFFMDRTFHVCTLAGESGVLYTGMTNNLMRRIGEHKEKKFQGFTSKYNLTKLVWFEAHGGPLALSPGKSRSKVGTERRKSR